MSNIGETLMSGRMAAKSLKSYSQVLATMQRTLLLLRGANARRPGQFGIYPAGWKRKLMRPPTDTIVSEARAHLSEVLSQQTKLPEYGSRWQPQVEAMGRDIPCLTDSDACLRYAQYNITFDGRPPFPGDSGIVQMREWAVANEFPQHAGALLLMSENPMSGAESLGEFNGRLVSLVMYYHARNVLAALTYANKPRRIVEIGGGYGEIARMWCKNPIAPPEFYVIADIPECLFFAEVALKAEFGDKVGYFDGSDPGSPILLVPLPFLADFKRSLRYRHQHRIDARDDGRMDRFLHVLAVALRHQIFLLPQLCSSADLDHG